MILNNYLFTKFQLLRTRFIMESSYKLYHQFQPFFNHLAISVEQQLFIYISLFKLLLQSLNFTLIILKLDKLFYNYFFIVK